MQASQNRYFQPEIMNHFLSKRENWIRWIGRDTGSLWFLANSSVNSEIKFRLTSSGQISVQDSALVRLNRRDLYAWQAQERDLYETAEQTSNKTKVEYNHLNAIAPERLLIDTIQKANQTFIEEYHMPLFQQQNLINNIQRKIHRFRSVEEDGLLSLASEINKYVLERIDTSSLRRNLNSNIQSRKTLKLLEGFFHQKLEYENASEIVAPLFGVNDLRNIHSHYTPDDQREEKYFEVIGINRSAPIVHQGAEMIDKVATAFSMLFAS